MVMDANAGLREDLRKGLPMEKIMEKWDFLQQQCACFINSDLPGFTSQVKKPQGKPVKSVLLLLLLSSE